MKAVITQDVYSHTRKSLQYAKRGETVTIISDFDTVFIVENKEGFRFPVHKSQLSYETQSSLFS